ncbi:ubinuclein-1 isoform X2 [Populus alba]|uniref:ubinuclein-1 isoform X2 n=1 Tax=Populus alba TaxID=43335 RepID=UPI001588D3EA|nr:ubinuclein-1-like isoform X2 [Populus alba]
MEVGNTKQGDTGSPPRRRFYIELNPGETTIVSWKKLLKDAAANKASSSQSQNQTTTDIDAVVAPASVDTDRQEAQFSLGQPTESVSKNAPSSNHLGSVIEKIEGLYVDEYFEIDGSTTEHDGVFVNKGKLEHMNKLISSTHRQPKKRRNNIQKAKEEKDDDHVRNKHAKLGHASMDIATRNKPLVEPFPTNSQSLAADGEHHHDGKLHSLTYPVESSDKKPAAPDIRSENSSYSGITNRDESISCTRLNNTENQMNGVLQPVNLGRSVKDTGELSVVAYEKYQENYAPSQLGLQTKRVATKTSNTSSPKFSQRNKKGRHELPDLNLPHYPVQAEKKTAIIHPKDVSSLQLKGSMLERAIGDLEKAVAESRPRNIEVQDTDASSTAIKRRLPSEVKQKLAKVAKLAVPKSFSCFSYSSQGKISEELINRLMSILGHLIQLRTLKKNLREMVEMGPTAKQEKADRFQLIRREVMEMIELQASKREKAGGDFQKAIIDEEKGAMDEKYVMDNKMEDKICDLYDLFVQGMDEDKGPHIRKLYVELAELWPNGAMDNHGIKNAIYRAKERRRTFYNNEKVQEKARLEELSKCWKDINVGGKATSVAQAKRPQEGLSTPAAITQYLSEPAKPLPPFLKGRNDDSPKQEKLEKMTFPMLKEQMRQQRREFNRGLKKSSPKVDKESHMSHKQEVEQQDGLKHHLTTSSSSLGQQN